jgi:endonuclease-3
MPKTAAKPRRTAKTAAHEARVDQIFELLAGSRPEPKTELDYINPFTLVVAVALSAQATDVGVNKATKALFKAADTPEKMVALGEDKIRDFIKTIGLYRNKAKNVLALSQKLIDEFGGEVPRSRHALESLPGVGRKTANVVMNEAFGEPTMAVDTHVFRVSNRTGIAPGKNPLQVELGLERVVHERFKQGAHHWLILHGRYTCVAQKPRCYACVIAELCPFTPKTAAPGEGNPSKAAAKTGKPVAPKKSANAKPAGKKKVTA